eukprot:gene6690-biopygen4969
MLSIRSWDLVRGRPRNGYSGVQWPAGFPSRTDSWWVPEKARNMPKQWESDSWTGRRVPAALHELRVRDPPLGGERLPHLRQRHDLRAFAKGRGAVAHQQVHPPRVGDHRRRLQPHGGGEAAHGRDVGAAELAQLRAQGGRSGHAAEQAVEVFHFLARLLQRPPPELRSPRG